MTRVAVDAFSDATACDVCGLEGCEDHLPVSATEPPARAPSLVAMPARDVITLPSPAEIIEGMAWAGCLTVLVSESGSGKTFVLLDAAAAMSDGGLWHGRAIRQGSVAYFSFEGDALGRRLQALCNTGRRLDNLYIIRAHDPLSPRVSRDGEERSIGELAAAAALDTLTQDLAATGRPPLVAGIIDTVRASLTGSEDSSEHVSAYLRAVRRLMAHVPGAACILAHHAGWQDGDQQRKRERGSSAWRGNCDATLYLEAGEYDERSGEAELTIRALKVRDAERPVPLRLVRRRVELLESNGHGEPMTSCVIESDRRSRADRDAAAAAAQADKDRATDLAVLAAMRNHKSATSISSLRPYVNLQTGKVGDSVARILRDGFATAGKRGEPFTITPAGLTLLNGHPT